MGSSTKQLAAILLIGLGCARSTPTPPPQRPVIVIVFDALSARHIHHLGYPRKTTPNIDRLAAAGVSYSNAFAPAPYTLASIPSIMTGTLPDRHKVVQVDRALGGGATTLAEGLHAAGYETFGAVANIKGGSLHGFDQGFDVFEELYRPADPSSDEQMHIVQPAAFVDTLERWVAERDVARTPFFYLHVLQPHLPYDPPAPHRDLWMDPAYDGPFRQGLDTQRQLAFSDSGGVLRPVSEEATARTGKHGITPADQKAIHALYDANIHYADAALEDMFTVLDEAGILDEALVVVTSDHGEAMWQHGRWGHSELVYDEMLSVPLIMRFPKGQPPISGINTALVSTLDITPTILQWLDLPAFADFDGQALAGVFDQAAPDPGRALLVRDHSQPTVFGLRSAARKVIAQPGIHEFGFNMKADPLEQNDKRLHNPSFAQQLVKRLQKRLAELNALPDPSVPAKQATSSEAALIGDLGYAE